MRAITICWALALMAVAGFAAPAWAAWSDPWNGIGRFFGYGVSDGYHARGPAPGWQPHGAYPAPEGETWQAPPPAHSPSPGPLRRLFRPAPAAPPPSYPWRNSSTLPPYLPTPPQGEYYGHPTPAEPPRPAYRGQPEFQLHDPPPAPDAHLWQEREVSGPSLHPAAPPPREPVETPTADHAARDPNLPDSDEIWIDIPDGSEKSSGLLRRNNSVLRRAPGEEPAAQPAAPAPATATTPAPPRPRWLGGVR